MRSHVCVSLMMAVLLGCLVNIGQCEVLVFRTLDRGHDGKPMSLPLLGTTGRVPSYARRQQTGMEIFFDRDTLTAHGGPMSGWWYTLPVTWTNTKNFPILIPGTFPEPDRTVDNFITETFTVSSFRIDATVFEGDSQPVRISGSTHADLYLPIEGQFTASQLRGTYRVEGATDSFETPFTIDYVLQQHSDRVKADLYTGLFAELLGIYIDFVPVNAEIASVVIDGVDVHARAMPYTFSFLTPEPSTGVLLLLGLFAFVRRQVR